MANNSINNGKKIFERRGKIFAYCMVAFAVVHFAVFFVYLNFEQFRLAFLFQTVDGEEIFTWDNFARIFYEFERPNSIMQYALVNTLQYWLMGVVKLVTSVLVAYFLWKKIPLNKTFLILFFLPNIIPSVMYVTLFKDMLSKDSPLFALVENLFDYQIPPLFSDDRYATNTIVFFTFWAGYGVNMLIYLGAFGRIPDGVIDAGKIDGCGWLRELWSIALPMIWETFSVMLILNVSTLFTATGNILLFTNMAEPPHTYTLSFWIYVLAQDTTEFGFASAMGIFYTIIAIPLVVLSRIIVSKMNKGVSY